MLKFPGSKGVQSNDLSKLAKSLFSYKVEMHERNLIISHSSSNLRRDLGHLCESNYSIENSDVYDNDISLNKSSLISFCKEKDEGKFMSKLGKGFNSMLSTNEAADNIRSKYFIKLMSRKGWIKPVNYNNIAILDWDDTLLCTSFLAPKGYFIEHQLSSEQESQIQILEEKVFCLLSTCINCCDTYIVTNSAQGWVEFSCLRFFPKVHSLLINLNIISARELFEKIHTGNLRKWKIETFQLIINKYKKDLLTNIVCIGDSFIEMEAGYLIVSEFEKALIKSIKFKEAPRLEELIRQLSLVNKQFMAIFSSLKSLKVTVERKASRSLEKIR